MEFQAEIPVKFLNLGPGSDLQCDLFLNGLNDFESSLVPAWNKTKSLYPTISCVVDIQRLEICRDEKVRSLRINVDSLVCCWTLSTVRRVSMLLIS